VIDAVILDTGPLVAFLLANEQHHAWTAERFKELPPNFLTCEPVLTEACFLLQLEPRAIHQIERFLEQSWLRLVFQISAEQGAVMRLMRKYREVPMSLADACLVRMSELHEGVPVLTLDRDFQIYRKNGRQRIPVIMP